MKYEVVFDRFSNAINVRNKKTHAIAHQVKVEPLRYGHKMAASIAMAQAKRLAEQLNKENVSD